MQVSVETTGTLERRMTVAVPEERISGEVKQRLASMRRRVRIDGFRPGKAPLPVVQRRFGRQVREEVVADVLRSTLYEALAQEKLKPAAMPQIDPDSLEQGDGLEYTAVFEVYPEFELAPCSELEIEKPVTDIDEKDIDGTIQTIREQRLRWKEKEGSAEDGDQLVLDFVGTVEGEPFDGGRAEDFRLVLGSGRMIDGFEAGLQGVKAGDERVVELTFPKEYHAAELAGREASFEIKVKRVESSELPELDDEFATHLGISGGVEGLRKEVEANMRRELDKTLQSRIKQQVIDALLAANRIELPNSMVDEEARSMAAQARQRLERQGMAAGAGKDGPDPSLFRDQAQKRVALGLIVSRIIKDNGIVAQPQDVRAAVEEMAHSYEEPQQVIDWYYEDKKRLAEVEALVLENKVIDWVLEQAKVTEKPLDFSELMKSPGGS